MPLLGYWQVTEVPLSTADGRSLGDPAVQYPWRGQALLTATDALAAEELPLSGGTLPKPGTEGSVFKSPLFVTVTVSRGGRGRRRRQGGRQAAWEAGSQEAARRRQRCLLPAALPSPTPKKQNTRLPPPCDVLPPPRCRAPRTRRWPLRARPSQSL